MRSCGGMTSHTPRCAFSSMSAQPSDKLSLQAPLLLLRQKRWGGVTLTQRKIQERPSARAAIGAALLVMYAISGWGQKMVGVGVHG